ncbi:MAG: FG-GAP repeat domain-containing protein [Longimicrobiales bacterium]
MRRSPDRAPQRRTHSTLRAVRQFLSPGGAPRMASDSPLPLACGRTFRLSGAFLLLLACGRTFRLPGAFLLVLACGRTFRLPGAFLLLLACAGGMAGPNAPAVSTRTADLTTFVRVINPFPVLDAAGTEYVHPFLGGLDVPRPQFIDIDADRDLDLFVQERTDHVAFFENTGTAQEPVFIWRTDRYQDLSLGEWNRFHDFDGDGDLDLLAEEKYSYVQYFRNEGNARDARFVLAEDSVKEATGKPLFSDRQNIPALADIDCDSVLDLFLGRVDGTVTLYTQMSSDSVPAFSFVQDRWEGIEIVAQFGSRHGANSMAFGDVDSDGDLDLLWGDFFEAGVLLIENGGACETPYLRTEPVPLPGADSLSTSGYNAPYLADIDADQDLDLFIGVLGGAFNPTRTASENFWFYERTAVGWRLQTRRYLSMVDVGNESTPALGDLDGDGDLDMLLANKIDPTGLRSARLYVFENRGTTTQPSFTLADTIDLSEAYHYAPELADLDGDDDLDLLLGTWNDGVHVFRNTGTAQAFRFEQDTTATVRIPRGSNTTPALADLDGDGDFDLLIGEAVGSLNLFRNTGTPAAPRFELEAEDWQGIDIGRRAFPSFVDLDADGDADLVIGREQAGAVVYRNTGTRDTPVFTLDEAASLPDLPPLATPRFADVDGDGDLDLISGTSSGGLVFWRNGEPASGER